MVFDNESITIPDGLVTDEFLIRPLLSTDVTLDYAAVMESKEFLRKWDQSSWPADNFTLAENLEDLQRHEREHINRESFTFTVMNPTETECLGCIYIFPLTARWLAKAEITTIGDKDWASCEAVILFWIRQSRLVEAMDRKLLNILRLWFEQEWTFDGYFFLTNEQFEQQVAMFEKAQLQLQIEVKLPKLPGKFLAYT
ncbi:MAG: N-acetyltransferase [Chloroflexi bacterium]|nr:MAG: N-acetyltransferase [Chloroflexota bacterium]